MPRDSARRKYFRRLFAFTVSLAALTCWEAVSVFAACEVPSFHLTNGYLAGGGRAVVRDFNNDGKLDVATNGTNNTVNVLLGNGAGGFASPVSYPVGLPSTTLESADFNNDGKLDLAVLSLRQSLDLNQIDVSILPGNGAGGFGAATGYSITAASNIPYTTADSLAVGDFNGDGKPDVAVGVRDTSQSFIAVLLNNGSGALLPQANSPVSVNVIVKPMIAGDFNSDGKVDLIVGLDQVRLLAGNGAGGFSAGTAVNAPDGGVMQDFSVTDFNSDGKPDVVVAQIGAPSKILLGNGSGGFTNVYLQTVILGPLQSVEGGGSTVGYFNSDGKLDVIIGKYIEIGDGQGGLHAGGTLPDLSGNFKVYSGDFNSDGQRDVIAYVNNNLLVYANRCGELTARSDYDGDGKADPAVWRPSNGYWFHRRSSDGVVVSTQWGIGSLGDMPVPGNYDNDGKTDLAVFRPFNGTWYILNSSDGSFRIQPWGQSGDKPVPADYDGDRKTDIAVYRPSNGFWYVLKSSDNTLFAQSFGKSADKPIPADYDGDGKTDIAVWRASEGNWYISQSSDNAFVFYHWGFSTDIPAPADYNGDGKAEITVFRQDDGNWITRNQDGTGSFYQANMAGAATIPQPGDYDGNGSYERTAWNALFNGRWWDGHSPGMINLGTTDDIPVSSPVGLN